jgi:hypothetical protein
MLCAYCGNEAAPTRDHVWPECFLQRQGRQAAHFAVRTGKVHGADYTVNDVCEVCNNERLSPLDAYFCALYDRHLATLHDFNTTLTFGYDFDLLARALLKIAYNSARAGGSDPGPLRVLTPYVLGSAPPARRFAIVAELVSPTTIADPGQPAGSERTVLPQMYRSAITQFLYPGAEALLTRIVAVNSYYFHLMIAKEEMLEEAFESLVAAFIARIQGTVRLSRTTAAVSLASSPQDGLRSFAPHLEKNRSQYEQFFARKRGENRRGKGK